MKRETAARVDAQKRVRALESERAAHAEAERRVQDLEREIKRLKEEVDSFRNTSLYTSTKRALLRRLLLAVHPDKTGSDTMFTATALTQIVTALLHEEDK